MQRFDPAVIGLATTPMLMQSHVKKSLEVLESLNTKTLLVKPAQVLLCSCKESKRIVTRTGVQSVINRALMLAFAMMFGTGACVAASVCGLSGQPELIPRCFV